MRKRLTPEQLTYLCELRNNGKTLSNFTLSPNYSTYSIRLKPEEYIKVIQNVPKKSNRVKQDTDKYILDTEKYSRVIELENLLDIKEKTADIEFYKIAPMKSIHSETISISLLSDIHIEEVVLRDSVLGMNEFNPKIAKKRLDNYFINLVKLVSHHQRNYDIKRHIIALLGDIIGGYIHDELAQTNAMTPLEAIAYAKTTLMSGFKYLQENLQVETIDVVCIVGNHGRTTDKLQYRNLTQTSYEYFLYKDLQEMCKMVGFDKFNFIIPNASMAVLELFSKRYLFIHGNQFKYQGGIGGLYVPLLRYFAKMAHTFNIDRMFFGHFHTSVGIKQAVGNGSVKGYDSYALGKGLDFEVAQQSMVLLNEKLGFTNFQTIFLD